MGGGVVGIDCHQVKLKLARLSPPEATNGDCLAGAMISRDCGLGTHDDGKQRSRLLLVMLASRFKLFEGVSLKTQKLYLVVFLTRYTDLFFRFLSWYNR